MADFYDDPATGKLFLCGAAGGGGSEYRGLATESDIRNHPEAYRAYLDAKKAVADRVQREDAAEIEELTDEQAAIEAKIEAFAAAHHLTVNAPQGEQIGTGGASESAKNEEKITS